MWLIRNSPRQEFERVWHTGLPADFDMPAVGKRLVRAHNDWTIRMAREHSTDRMRPVAILATDRLDQMMAELERLLDEGVRGFWIPTSEPPGGLSPEIGKASCRATVCEYVKISVCAVSYKKKK